MNHFFSTYDIAKICHVSPGSINRWIHEGKLTASLTAGGHHRVHGSDVVQLLKSLRMPIPKELKGIESSNHRSSTLIVDDDQQVRRLIRGVLEKDFPNMKIREAANGFTAGWFARSLRPQIVILDLKMSGIDGFQTCKFIRSLAELNHTRIIIISGLGVKNQDEDKIMGLGANDFLPRPFTLEELKKRVEKQLSVCKREESDQ